MLETNRTNVNNFVVSQAVTELVANSILNEGLTLLKVASGGVNEDTQVYYFSNNIGHMLPTDDYTDREFAVKLVFLRRESIKVDERMSERNLFIYGIDKFTISQAYTDNDVAATGFLDYLYEQLNHETLAEYYIYEETLFTSLNDLIDFHLANKR
jgi:hypothetical protein